MIADLSGDVGPAADFLTILIGLLPVSGSGTNLFMRLPERGLRPAPGVVLLGAGLALPSKAWS